MIFRVLLLVGVYFTNLTIVLPQSAMDAQEILQLIEGFEEQVAFVDFVVRPIETTAKEVDQKWVVAPPVARIIRENESGVYTSKFRTAFQPSDEHFLVEYQTAMKSSLKGDGSKNDMFTYNAHRGRYSSDGKLFQSELIGDRFKTPPTKAGRDATWGSATGLRVENFATVSSWDSHANYIGGDNEDAIKKFGNRWFLGGIGTMAWTAYERPTLLSKFLRQKIAAGDEIIAREVSKGTVEIFCNIYKSHSFSYLVKFFYDSIHGRIKRIEWGGCENCKVIDPDDWWAVRIAFFEYDDDTVLPNVVNHIEFPGERTGYKSGMTCEVVQHQLTDRSVSSKKKDKEFFRFDFTNGVEVSDYINNRVYIVGDGLENDIASVEKFMTLNGLVQTESLTPRIPWRWVFPTLVVVLLSTCAVFIFRRRALVALMTISLCSFNFGATAQTSEPDIRNADNELTFPGPSSRQCGHMVTAAACAYFRVPADADIIEAAMKPAALGTSLLQIKQALELHGLSVKAQKCESLNSLLKLLNPSAVVIVPFVLHNGRGHYGMVVQKQTGAAPMLVDVLNAVSPVTDSKLSDESLKAVNGIVLLVSKGLPSRPVAITAMVSVVEIGDVVIDKSLSDIIDFAIDIENKGEVPAFVELRTSCGCVRPKESKIVVDKNASYSAKFFLSRNSWGLGEIERYVEIQPKHGTSSVVTLRGRGIRTSKANQGISLSTQHLLLAAQPYTSLQTLAFAPAHFEAYGSKDRLESLKATCEHTWVKATKGRVVTNGSEETSSIGIELEFFPNEFVFQKLQDEARQFSCGIKLATTDEKEPAEMKLTFVRPSIVKARVGIPDIPQHSRQVELYTNFPNQDFEISEFEPVGEHPAFTVESTGDKHLFVVRWAEDAPAPFSGLIRFRISGAWGNEVVMVSCAVPRKEEG